MAKFSEEQDRKGQCDDSCAYRHHQKRRLREAVRVEVVVACWISDSGLRSPCLVGREGTADVTATQICQLAE